MDGRRRKNGGKSEKQGGGEVIVLVTGVGSGGYAGDLTPQLFMWGILICVSHPSKEI